MALVAQNDQLKQGLKAAIDEAHSAQRDLDEAEDKLRDKTKSEETDRYNAETNRLKVTGANVDQISAIVSQMVNDMLSSAAALPGDNQMMPEGPPEQMPADIPQQGSMPPEPLDPGMETETMPTGPSPDVLAILEAQGQQNAQLVEAIQSLIMEIAKPRMRIPVKDKNGDILHVIEQTRTMQ